MIKESKGSKYFLQYLRINDRRIIKLFGIIIFKQLKNRKSLFGGRCNFHISSTPPNLTRVIAEAHIHQVQRNVTQFTFQLPTAYLQADQLFQISKLEIQIILVKFFVSY